MSDKNKISKKTINYIFNALKVAMAIKCEQVLFDDFGVSGRSTVTNILMIQPLDHEFEFPALGVGRVDDLHARMKLIIDDPTLSAYYEETRDGKVGKVVFKTKNTKVEFRCMDANKISTQKKLKNPTFFTFNLNADAIKFMTSGASAMKNKAVTFKLDDGKIYIRLVDNEGDILDHFVTEDVEISDDCDVDKFSFSYEFPKLAAILNAHKENTIVNITQRGFMHLKSEGFSLYLIPDF